MPVLRAIPRLGQDISAARRRRRFTQASLAERIAYRRSSRVIDPSGQQGVLWLCTNRLRGTQLRTNIEIDDKLMKDALKATGAKTKREAVELGLRTLVRLRAQEKAKELRGRITWEGDLNAMRTDR